MTFEVSWVQDDQKVWHTSPHATGYVESTSPWIFTTTCGRHIDTEVPPLPSAPVSGQRCSDCAGHEPSVSDQE
jgi:hypothetical protein